MPAGRRWYSAALFEERNSQLLAAPSGLYPLIQDARAPEIPVVRVKHVAKRWGSIEHEQTPQTDTVQVEGRIASIRQSGKGLIFMDIVQDEERLQVVVNKKKAGIADDAFEKDHRLLRRGDIVNVSGKPWRTRRGELSVLADSSVKLLAPCLHALPEKMTDERRTQHRVEDLLVHRDSRDVLAARAVILRSVRAFFEDRNFTEVQTPILASQATGAAANPFVTSSHALGSDDGLPAELFLRIAPELWLKRLVISGFDRVFEVGPCFRNEGIDATHNPEFTSCEFYQAYATLDDLVQTTQDLLSSVFARVADRFPQYQNTNLREAFAKPPNTVSFIEEVESRSGRPLPDDLTDTDALLAHLRSLGVEPPSDGSLSAAKLLDALSGEFIEPFCDGPTYITLHPAAMSPLAKSATVTINGRNRLVSRRFELFIDGREYVNAYEEENSPLAQETKFSQQLVDREKFHDTEAPVPDASYVRALEYGLPPTGGWGLGIDRLVMLATGSPRINQVLSFGGIKAVNYQQ